MAIIRRCSKVSHVSHLFNRWVAEVHRGRGYQSHHGTRLHFGLGKRESIDRSEIRWMGGAAPFWKNSLRIAF